MGIISKAHQKQIKLILLNLSLDRCLLITMLVCHIWLALVFHLAMSEQGLNIKFFHFSAKLESSFRKVTTPDQFLAWAETDLFSQAPGSAFRAEFTQFGSWRMV